MGLTEDGGDLGCRCVPRKGPPNESVGVSVAHSVLGLQVTDDRHVLL